MREHLNAKETVDCTFIIHNITIIWGDDLPPEENHLPPEEDQDNRDGDGADNGARPQYVIVHDDTPPNVIRQRGQEKRDALIREMPLATRKERNRLRR